MSDDQAAQHAHDHRHLVAEPHDSALSVSLQIIAWFIALVMFLLIVALVVVPRLTGSEPFTVLTSSMVPKMPPGTVVITKPLAFSQIKVGDVVTYQINSGEKAVVTHRV